jgi:hypothetical protein
LNYAFSWFSMIAIILGLEFTLGWFTEILLFSQKYSVRINTFRSNFKPSNLNIWTVKFEWLCWRKYSVQIQIFLNENKYKCEFGMNGLGGLMGRNLSYA